MLDRAACERRVYRLATLLTGDPVAASKVIEQVVDAQPDLRALDSAHMDRLTVLRSREIRPAMIVDDRIPPKAAEALAGLSPQQREAWVMAKIYRAPDREIARAMDCSVTATHRHLDSAQSAMNKHLGSDSGSATADLLSYSMSLDVPRFYRMERMRRRQTRIVLIVIAGAIVALVVGALLMWWGRPPGD